MLFLRKECREIQSFAKIFSGALLFLWKPTPPKNSKSTRSVPQLVFLTKVRLWYAGQDWEALPPFSVNYGIIKTCLCSFASLFAHGRIRTCVGRRPPGLQPGTIDHSVTCASTICAYYTPNFRKTKL